jgi:hypothetical protein
MMTQEKNAMLTGVSPGSPLHRPLSRFLFPVLRSERLADRYTHKVRLLGEDFVVARRGKEVFALDDQSLMSCRNHSVGITRPTFRFTACS